jgi:hypothetical protein
VYFVLDRSGARNPCRWVAAWPSLPGVSWSSGAWITAEIPAPLEVTLEPLGNDSDEGPALPAWLKGTIPLVRRDLVAALQRCGVDHLQLFDAVVIDPDDGSRHALYQAVNVLGLIAAADLDRSEVTVHPSGPSVIDVDFDSLVVDEAKTHGALLFRLAESTNALLVHDKLRRCLLAAGFDELDFRDPAKVAL